MRQRQDAAALRGLIAGALADPRTGWSLGAYGAAILVPPGARPLPGRLAAVVPGGALAFGDPGALRAFAYETALGGGAWSHAVALCLPAESCPTGLPDRVTALGPDRAAARPEDRDGELFDLGLGLRAARLCLRARDGAALAALRAARGRAPSEAVLAALLALPCDRVVLAGGHRAEALHRGEARPGEDAGPRLQILPKLLRQRRSHAATAPIPAGLVPIGSLQPPHPLAGGGFDAARHRAFQALLAAFGDPDLLALKRRVLAGEAVPPPATRAGRGSLRVAQAQARWRDGPGPA
ncbi:DUF6925 family protein [Methylobacterium sp. WSM2598]|uniref:DUF6925 family protein n=1 Tax=Methylobacterium sp. WSM2598 TaxID=398261 RepID=UPI00037E4566|nr:hypothetical protein [Methylobacterium sp. WSM2598]